MAATPKDTFTLDHFGKLYSGKGFVL